MRWKAIFRITSLARQRELSVTPASRRLVDSVLAVLLRISPEEASFTRRGFPAASEEARKHLEHVGRCFLRGYNEGLGGHEAIELSNALNRVELTYRGFALEGIAMALTMLGYITPWRRQRFDQLLRHCGDEHLYMALIGAGWAVARLRRPLGPILSRCDALLGWLVADGMGFHEGYFKWRRFVLRGERPASLHGYALRAFDQGLGRSIWFVGGADAQRISHLAETFALSRRADLWSGIGLAAAYAGGIKHEGLITLGRLAASNASALAQGAVFAAKTRDRAGNIASHTDAACQILCGMTAREAAQLADDTLAALPKPYTTSSYENWRLAIQERFNSSPSVP
jgi:enediyne biosynthesis protein E3